MIFCVFSIVLFKKRAHVQSRWAFPSCTVFPGARNGRARSTRSQTRHSDSLLGRTPGFTESAQVSSLFYAMRQWEGRMISSFWGSPLERFWESLGCRADPLTEALAVLQRKGTEFVGPKPRSVAMTIICVLPDGLHITSSSLTSPDPDDGISR